mmetsp:Transcript_10669/g.31170  ORF Transcript_10669/g.31170 Transcript_10669/m.31170 type:complete len:227 (+) Transcript_10669:705-1385(+)
MDFASALWQLLYLLSHDLLFHNEPHAGLVQKGCKQRARQRQGRTALFDALQQDLDGFRHVHGLCSQLELAEAFVKVRKEMVCFDGGQVESQRRFNVLRALGTTGGSRDTGRQACGGGRVSRYEVAKEASQREERSDFWLPGFLVAGGNVKVHKALSQRLDHVGHQLEGRQKVGREIRGGLIRSRFVDGRQVLPFHKGPRQHHPPIANGLLPLAGFFCCHFRQRDEH